MKRRETQQDANWGGSPSSIHHWMEAMLRLAAMFLANLACFFGMRLSRYSGECHTGATPEALPQSDCDPTSKETTSAEAISHKPAIALMVSSERSSRPSNREGVLTPVRSPAQPARCRTTSSLHPADFSRPDPAAGRRLIAPV